MRNIESGRSLEQAFVLRTSRTAELGSDGVEGSETIKGVFDSYTVLQPLGAPNQVTTCPKAIPLKQLLHRSSILARGPVRYEGDPILAPSSDERIYVFLPSRVEC